MLFKTIFTFKQTIFYITIYEYLLFETEEGKIAVAIEKRKNVKKGESLYKEYLFEELSDEESEAV